MELSLVSPALMTGVWILFDLGSDKYRDIDLWFSFPRWPFHETRCCPGVNVSVPPTAQNFATGSPRASVTPRDCFWNMTGKCSF